MAKMELPIELVRIVNEVLREKEMVEWPSLKKRLLEPNVEHVLKAMDEYLEAKELYNHASREYDDLPFVETDEEDWTVEESKVANSSAKKCDYFFWRVLASSRGLDRVVHTV